MEKSVLGLLRQVRDKQKKEREELKLFVTIWNEIENPNLKDILEFQEYIQKELGVRVGYTEGCGFREKSLKNTKIPVR